MDENNPTDSPDSGPPTDPTGPPDPADNTTSGNADNKVAAEVMEIFLVLTTLMYQLTMNRDGRKVVESRARKVLLPPVWDRTKSSCTDDGGDPVMLARLLAEMMMSSLWLQQNYVLELLEKARHRPEIDHDGGLHKNAELSLMYITQMVWIQTHKQFRSMCLSQCMSWSLSGSLAPCAGFGYHSTPTTALRILILSNLQGCTTR